MKDTVLYNVDKENGILCWQVRKNMSAEDARKFGDLIKEAVDSMKDKDIKLLVDNRYMMRSGRAIVFAVEVNEIWEEIQAYVLPKVSKVSVLCSSPIMKMQMDRLARNSGLISKQSSFYNEDLTVTASEAYKFLGITSNELIDSKYE